MSEHWTSFVADDPWFRPLAEHVEQARRFLLEKLESPGEIQVCDEETVSVFFSPKDGIESRCPRCGAELSQESAAAWFSEDYVKGSGFRLQPRAMACCGSPVALNQLVNQGRFVFARFGIEIQHPTWKFQNVLPSERLVKEMTYQRSRDEPEEWRARHTRWSADIVAGENRIAMELEPILGCGVLVAHGAF
jgi:hypothetical protein